MTIHLSDYQRIVVLTGAGISVASGLRPYRGPGGLWEEYSVEDYGTAQAFDGNPARMWKLFDELRRQIPQVVPNRAHLRLAALEHSLASDQSFLLVTQNIDGLHQRAGSKNVAEIHGNVMRTRCSNQDCALKPFEVQAVPEDESHVCHLCGAMLRPDVVMFGEPVAHEPGWRAKKALRDVDLFIAIGTSGLVSPASNYVRAAEYAGARTVYVNIDPIPEPHKFRDVLIGKAEDVLGTEIAP